MPADWQAGEPRDAFRRRHGHASMDAGYPFALVTAALVLVSLCDIVLASVAPVSVVSIRKLFHVTPGSLTWVISVQLVASGV